MRVRLKTRSAGPEGPLPIGAVIEVDEIEGKQLVDTGQAEFVESRPTPLKPDDGDPGEVSTRPTATGAADTKPKKQRQNQPSPLEVLTAAGIEEEHAQFLVDGGLTSVDEVLAHEDLTKIPHIGKVTKERILAALGAAEADEE